MDPRMAVNSRRRELDIARFDERLWSGIVARHTSRCHLLQDAVNAAKKTEAAAYGLRGSPTRGDYDGDWCKVVDKAGQCLKAYQEDLQHYQQQLRDAKSKLKDYQTSAVQAYTNLQEALRQEKLMLERERKAQRAEQRHRKVAEERAAAQEKAAKEKAAREREREAQQKRQAQWDRFRREAKARETLRGKIYNQNAKEEASKRASEGITAQKIKSFRQQATEMFQDYATITAFPEPPSEPCKRVACQSTVCVLEACPCNIRKCFTGLGVKELRVERVKWHPDKFAKCQGGRTSVKALQEKAKEVFVVVEAMYQEAVAKEKKW